MILGVRLTAPQNRRKLPSSHARGKDTKPQFVTFLLQRKENEVIEILQSIHLKVRNSDLAQSARWCYTEKEAAGLK